MDIEKEWLKVEDKLLEDTLYINNKEKIVDAINNDDPLN